MADISTKLTERRAELLRQADEHHKAILAITRDARVTDAALAEIEFAIAACADCAGSGEATPHEEAISGAPQGEEETGRSAGIASDPMLSGGVALDEAAAHKQFEGTARLKLLNFLTRWPDSTMAEIRAAGISAGEVYRAEMDEVVIVKDQERIYALPEAEAQQSEAAE